MGNALNRLVFQPPSPTYDKDPNLLWLSTRENETIPSFFINRGARLTILFSHGNAEDLGMVVNYFREASVEWNVNVFAYEYSGYGQSTGTPSEASVYADAQAAFEYLRSRGIPIESIVLYGRSLGSAPAIHLAASNPGVGGLILQSPLSSIFRVGLDTRVSLPGDIFCNIDKIGRVHCPTYIIHGTDDAVVPVAHGMVLFKRCPNAVTPFWVEGAGHNNLELTAGGAFSDNMERFLRHLDNRLLLRGQNRSLRVRENSSSRSVSNSLHPAISSYFLAPTIPLTN